MCEFKIICIWGREHSRSCSNEATFGEELQKMCSELNLRDWWLFGLQPAGRPETSWVNCRNRVDLQIVSDSKFHLKIKYFPPNSNMRLSTKRYLLTQLFSSKKFSIKNADILTGPETSKIIDELEQDDTYGSYLAKLENNENLVISRFGIQM